jgi:hypothetical protein
MNHYTLFGKTVEVLDVKGSGTYQYPLCSKWKRMHIVTKELFHA